MTYEWKIRLFAGLPERIGADEITFADPREAMTAGELKRLLAELHPDQEGLIRLSFVACNRAYAADDARVSVRDELALLPPVSGGESAAGEADRSSGDSRFSSRASRSSSKMSSPALSRRNTARHSFSSERRANGRTASGRFAWNTKPTNRWPS
ncbi:MoaD/ThiS family protein [Paenibacillus cisolokensis]|uniref:MoaD/ThiS family protein n=1 Tax=Paenibacillus cisolokensis TaxID=1658519 RepID=UPI0027DDFE97|nr:MoaD/ThiS family protein [Paenibacillus cisolokensis]